MTGPAGPSAPVSPLRPRFRGVVHQWSFFVALAEEARPKLRAEPQVEWLQRLEKENGNLRAALSWAISTDEMVMAAWLSFALWMFWWQRGHFAEGLGWLERSLHVRAGPAVRARAAAPSPPRGL